MPLAFLAVMALTRFSKYRLGSFSSVLSSSRAPPSPSTLGGCAAACSAFLACAGRAQRARHKLAAVTNRQLIGFPPSVCNPGALLLLLRCSLLACFSAFSCATRLAFWRFLNSLHVAQQGGVLSSAWPAELPDADRASHQTHACQIHAGTHLLPLHLLASCSAARPSHP